MLNWGRLITAMVTPFDREGKLDVKGAVTLANKLAKEGTTALVLAGTTGESPTLTKDEKITLFSEVKKNTTIPIIANVGTNNTEDSVKMAQEAVNAGVDGIMAVVPYYNKPNQAGIIAHYQAIAQAAQIPVMVYNVPGRPGLNLDAETILKLSELSHIACIKEATGDFDKISRILREAPADFLVYTGEDQLTLPVLSIGGYGVVSVASNIVSSRIKRMIDSYLAGEVVQAKEHHLALTPLYKSLFATANPIPVKAALKILGFDAGTLRLPLVEADDAIVKDGGYYKAKIKGVAVMGRIENHVILGSPCERPK